MSSQQRGKVPSLNRRNAASNLDQRLPRTNQTLGYSSFSHSQSRPSKHVVRRGANSQFGLDDSADDYTLPNLNNGINLDHQSIDGLEDELGDDIEDSMVLEKKNLKWTDEMDACLVDGLMEQKLKGQKIGGVFTRTAYKATAANVSSTFQIFCDSAHVKNRVKTLKKHLASVKDILQNGSGFGFNYTTKMIEAEAGVWDAYLKAKPTVSYLRHTPFPNYENLDEIFGKDRATGSRAVGVKQRRMEWEREQNRVSTNEKHSLEERERDGWNDGKDDNNEESSHQDPQLKNQEKRRQEW